MALSPCEPAVAQLVDLRALAVLSLSPSDLGSQCGATFAVIEDDLDEFEVAAVQVGELRFVLMRGIHEPLDGTNVLTPDAGDTDELLDQFLVGASLTYDDVKLVWEGHDWVAPPTTE